MFVRYDSFKNHSTKIGNYFYRSKNWTFLQHCIRFNVEKVVVKVLEGSVVTQTMLGRLTISSDCEFPMVYIMCQKL